MDFINVAEKPLPFSKGENEARGDTTSFRTHPWLSASSVISVFPTIVLFDRWCFKKGEATSHQLSCLLKIFLSISSHFVAKNMIEEKEFIPCYRKNQLFTDTRVEFRGENIRPH